MKVIYQASEKRPAVETLYLPDFFFGFVSVKGRGAGSGFCG